MKSKLVWAGPVALLCFFFACSGEQSRQAAVQSAVTELFVATDDRDWDAVRSAFADRVQLDYTSFVGGQPATLTPEQIAANWAGLMPGFDATHHQLGNFRISTEDGDRARARLYGTATHYIANAPGGAIWTVVGTYDFTLKRSGPTYRIESMKFNFKYQDGNRNLAALATERAKASE